MNLRAGFFLLPALLCLFLSACTGIGQGTQAGSALPPAGREPAPTVPVAVLPRETRPNIVLILVDDLDARLATTDYMPNLQELMIEQGFVIDSFFVSDPTCCPSRATILRGQYAHSHQIYSSTAVQGFQEFYALGHDSSTVATWLQSAGYRTILLGKYLNGYPLAQDRTYVPQGWEQWFSPARGKPYTGFNYTLNENGTLVAYGSGPDDYLADVLSRQAEKFLLAAAEDKRPFFMFLNPFQPHEPAVPAPRHARLFEGLAAPRTESFNEADVLDKPPHIRYDPQLTSQQVQDLDDLYVRRVQSMQAVDELIAQLFAMLESTGQLANTYVLFTSDNGFHLGQHRMWAGKGTPYDEDINVPFVIRGPGIPAGAQLEGFLTGNVDVAPTLADLAGVRPPPTAEGRSLVPLFALPTSENLDWRQAYLLEYYPGNQSEAAAGKLASLRPQSGILEPGDLDDRTALVPTAAYRGLRTDQYLYVEYVDGFRELYDLDQDPFELQNIVDRSDPELLATLSAWLEDLSTCTGSSCLTVESRQFP
jgi:arylsulfatase A-like enzyme